MGCQIEITYYNLEDLGFRLSSQKVHDLRNFP